MVNVQFAIHSIFNLEDSSVWSKAKKKKLTIRTKEYVRRQKQIKSNGLLYLFWVWKYFQFYKTVYFSPQYNNKSFN